MKKLLLMMSVVATMFAASCTKCNEPAPTCIDKSLINKSAACYDIYAPVCGCDGVTYSNDCHAKNSGVTKWTKGECRNDIK